jgi:ABC-type nitrate/sulfonate/bicarbonate transport system permease component
LRSYAPATGGSSGSCASPALPYIFAALKISATASVVGAIIGELPSSIQDGLGGRSSTTASTTRPADRLWATNVIAAALGIRSSSSSSSREARRAPAPENFA